jgi:hypothetical protein
MNTKTRAGVSLNEAANLLKQALGDAAPARITLHRHSAAGALSSMVLSRTKSRSYYNINALITHYRPAERVPLPSAGGGTHPVQDPIQTERHATTQSTPMLNTEETAQALAQLVTPLIEKQIAHALQPLSELLRKIEGGLNDLASTRNMLMLKYDAAATLTNQRLDAAKAEVARLKGTADTDQQIYRIRQDISRLVDAIARIHPNQT